MCTCVHTAMYICTKMWAQHYVYVYKNNQIHIIQAHIVYVYVFILLCICVHGCLHSAMYMCT